MKLLVPLLFAASLSAAPALFPLETGNEWKYRHAATGATISIRVGLPVYMADQVYHHLSGYVLKPVLVRAGENGNLFYRDEENERDVLLTSFEPVDRGWFEAPLRECEQEGHVDSQRGAYKGPAGEYGSVVKIEYRTTACADAGTLEELYAENIGMLSRTVQTIAGPRQFELVSARVGKLTINAEPSGVFSLTLNQPIASDSTAIATLRLNVERPLKVRQHSPQEFDVVLRSSDGRLLWQWSEGQAFPPVIVEKTISGEQRWQVQIPLRILEAPLPSDDYVVEAWLNTGEDRPQFAAAATLKLGPESDPGMIE